MELTVGQIVCAAAGRDKGKFFVVIGLESGMFLLCDGKNRALSRPKRKKSIHIRPTSTVLKPDEFRTDKAIRKALRPFAEQV